MGRLIQNLLSQRAAAVLAVAVLVLVIYLVGPLAGVDPVWRHVAAGAVTLLAGVAVFVQRHRAAKAASALEAALKAQGQSQVGGTRPDQRAGIEELKSTFDESLDLLRKSKMGRGALHSIPWYMLIGPPGSGKSTLLRQSGLSFPYMTKGRSAIRGLGGTKNCDWWFADRGILLDTAGRYTTEAEDRDEWMAFLRLMKRGRGRRPVNGVVVAMGLAELIESTDAELNLHAENVRDRIDELTRELQAVFPIYVVFTKCDRLRGFVETFDTLSKEQRKQVWGFTFAFERGRDFVVAEQFGKEFDELYRALTQRRVELLASDHFRKRKAQVYAFPLQFLRVKERLQAFLGQLQQPNPYQEVSPVRGVYFTSGTQEGTTIDRILKVLRPAELELDVPEDQRRCYFVDDLFERVVFDDATLARPTAQAQKRDRLLRTAGLAGLGVLALATIVLRWGAWSDFSATCATIAANAGVGERSPAELRKALDAQREILDSESHRHHLESGGVRENLKAWYDRTLVAYATAALGAHATQEANKIADGLPDPTAATANKETVYAQYAEGGRRLAVLENGLAALDARTEADRAAALALWEAAIDATPLGRRHFDHLFALPKLALAVPARTVEMRFTREKLYGLLNREDKNDLTAAKGLDFDRLFPNAWKALKEKETPLGACRNVPAKPWSTRALAVAAKGPLFAKESTRPGSPTIEEFFEMARKDRDAALGRPGDTSGRPLREMRESAWEAHVATRYAEFLRLVDSDFDVNWQSLLRRLEELADGLGEAKDQDDAGCARLEVVPELVAAYRLGKLVLDQRGEVAADVQTARLKEFLDEARQKHDHSVPNWAKTPGVPRSDAQPAQSVDRAKVAAKYRTAEEQRVFGVAWGVPILEERFRELEFALVEAVCNREWAACRGEIADFARRGPFKLWNEMLARFPFTASAADDASAAQMTEAVRAMTVLDDEIARLEPKGAFALAPAFAEDLEAMRQLRLVLFGGAVTSGPPSIDVMLAVETGGAVNDVKIEGENRSIAIPPANPVAWPLREAESLGFTAKTVAGDTWSFAELLDPRGNTVPASWLPGRRLVSGPWCLKRLFSLGRIEVLPSGQRVSRLQFRGRTDDCVLLIVTATKQEHAAVFDGDWPGDRFVLSNTMWKEP